VTRATTSPAGFWICCGLSIALTVVGLGFLQDWEFEKFVVVFALQLAVYGYAAWQLIRGSWCRILARRHTLIAILLVAAVLRAVALFAPQALSTDAYRYVWDGRVQAAGINPYRYIPADPALSALRDASIYPNINRAQYAPTIYPPTAQLAFLGIERVSDSLIGMKLGMLVFDAVSIGCLLALLRRNGLPAARVLLYAWHPLPIWEFAGTGHVDAVAIALVLLAFLAAARRAPMWSGVALAAATLVKFYPAVVAPALYRRWDWRLPAAFVVTLIVLYLPYLSVGSRVFGFLSGYAAEEGLRDGSGIFLWSILKVWCHVPDPVMHYFPLFAALLLLGAALWTQRSDHTRAPGDVAAALALASVFTLVVSPHDPWYFTWLVPFLCFRFTIATCWLTGACTLMYVLPEPTGLKAQSLIYVPFLILSILQYFFARQFTSPEVLHANRAPSHSSA
jgi:alpha-1,6-mannosyltransferase